MDENHQNHISQTPFFLRILRSIAFAFVLFGVSLGIGMWGYHHFEKMSWIDSYVNASMILSGMGPLDPLHTEKGKLFAGTFALYSGVTFLVIMAIVWAPILHRFMKKLHLDTQKKI